MTTTTDKLLTVKDLMTRWNCTYPPAFQAMHSKELKAVKVAGKLQARLKDVERYEEMRRVAV